MTLPMTKLDFQLITSFRDKLGQKDAMPYDEFIEWALYDPRIGYYTKRKKRVGKANDSDFYTSTSFGRLWTELVLSAFMSLIGKNQIADYSFVEIAAEPDSCLLGSIEHPFKSHNVFRLGESIDIPSPCIVYSNEWLDAQPFKRFSYSGKKELWNELGVSLQNDCLKEVILETSDQDIEPPLPVPHGNTKDGYLLDWPTGAEKALKQIIKDSKWKGLFLTFDYGLSMDSLLRESPAGTARAYKNHQVSNNLFQSPGEHDITCHLCWEILESLMKQSGFKEITIQSQESFLINHSSRVIKKIIEEKDSNETNALKELIHPLHMGQKFQALWGRR